MKKKYFNKKINNKIIWILKFLLTLIFFYIIFKKVNITSIKNIKFNNIFFIWGIIYYIINYIEQYIVMTYKWKILLNAFNENINFSQIYKINAVSLFFNNIIPGKIGSDLVRGYRISKISNNKSHSFYTIYFDRLMGINTLIFLSIISYIILKHKNIFNNENIIILMLIIFTVIGILLLFPNLLLNKIKKYLPKKFQNIIEKIHISTNLLFSYKKIIFKNMILSFICHILLITVYIGAALSLGLNIKIMRTFFLSVPLGLILSTFPVTIGNLGYRESLFIFFMSNISGLGGIMPALISLSVYISNASLSLIGLYYYLKKY